MSVVRPHALSYTKLPMNTHRKPSGSRPRSARQGLALTQRRDRQPRYRVFGNLLADLLSGERTEKKAVGCCTYRIDGPKQVEQSQL